MAGGFSYGQFGLGPHNQGGAPSGPTELYLDDQLSSQYSGFMNPNAVSGDVVAIATIQGGATPFGITSSNAKFVGGSAGTSVQLKVAPGAVFTPTADEDITITATDNNGNPIIRTFTIRVSSIPTDISLSPSTIANNAPAGTQVGALFSSGGEVPLVYTWVANTDYDVSGSTLVRSASGTISPGTDSVTVRVTDYWGNYFEKDLDVIVEDHSAQHTIFYHTFINRTGTITPAESVTEYFTIPLPNDDAHALDGSEFPSFQLLDNTEIPYSFQSGTRTTWQSGNTSLARACLRLPNAIPAIASVTGTLAAVDVSTKTSTLLTWSTAISTPGTFTDGDCLLIPLDGTWPAGVSSGGGAYGGLSDTGFVRVVNAGAGTFRLYYTYQDYLDSTNAQIARSSVIGGSATKASYVVVLCKDQGTMPTPSTLSISDVPSGLKIEVDCLPYIETGLVPAGDYAHSGTWVAALADVDTHTTEIINGDAGVGYHCRALFKQAGHSDEYRIWGEFDLHLGQDENGDLAQIRVRSAVTQPPWNPPKPGSGNTNPDNTTSKRALAFSGVRLMNGASTLIDQANLIPPEMDQGLFHNAFPMYFYQNSFGHNGYAVGGTTTTVVLAVGANTSNNFYNGLTINFIAGPGSVASATITGYVGSTRTATFTPAIGASPTTATAYMVLGVGTGQFIAPDCQIHYGTVGGGTYCAQPGSSGTLPANLSSTGVYNVAYLEKTKDVSGSDDPDILTGVILAGATSTTVVLPPWAPTPNAILVGTTGQIKYRNTTGTDKTEKTITAYNSATKVITISPAFTVTPSTGAGFRIYSAPGTAMFSFQTVTNNFAGASNVSVKNSDAGTGNLTLTLNTVCCYFSGFFIQEGLTPERFTIPGVGSAPDDLGKMLHIQYDRDTLRRSGKLFPYDFTFGADAGNAIAESVYVPNGTGPAVQGNAATGERPELAAIAEYAASWCINQSYADWITNQVIGLIGLHMSMHAREWTTWEIQPVITNLSQGYHVSGPWTGLPTPNATFRFDPGSTCAPFTTPGAPLSGHGSPLYTSMSFAALSNEHQPQFAMGGSVATGWVELYEIVKDQAQFGISNPASSATPTAATATCVSASNRNKTLDGVLYQGIAYCESQERNQAWDLAQMACYAAIAPDGGARNYFRDELQTNAVVLTTWMENIVRPTNSYAADNGVYVTSVNGLATPMWEWGYIWWAMALALGGSETSGVVTLMDSWFDFLRHVLGAITVDGIPRGDYWGTPYHTVMRNGALNTSPLASRDEDLAIAACSLTWDAAGKFTMYTPSDRLNDMTLPSGNGGWIRWSEGQTKPGAAWSTFTTYYIVGAVPNGATFGNLGTFYLSTTPGGSHKIDVSAAQLGRVEANVWPLAPGTTRWVQGAADTLGYGPNMLGAIQALRTAGVAISDADMDTFVANMQTRRQTYINEGSSVFAESPKWLTTNLNG